VCNGGYCRSGKCVAAQPDGGTPDGGEYAAPSPYSCISCSTAGAPAVELVLGIALLLLRRRPRGRRAPARPRSPLSAGAPRKAALADEGDNQLATGRQAGATEARSAPEAEACGALVCRLPPRERRFRRPVTATATGTHRRGYSGRPKRGNRR
jgi:hypothetical protein